MLWFPVGTGSISKNIAIFNSVRYPDRPNPLTPTRRGKGEKFKASLLKGERFGERSKLYSAQLRKAINFLQNYQSQWHVFYY